VSYKGEVFVQGEWGSNALRFETADEASGYVRDLACRWTMVEDSRTVASDEPATDIWDSATGLRSIDKPESGARFPAYRVQL